MDLAEHFDRFLCALTKVEGGQSSNTAYFELHRVRNKVYAELDERLVTEVSQEWLEEVKEELEKIRLPAQSEKRDELLKHLDDLVAVLSGVRDRSLRTQIKTRLPYILHRAPLPLTFQWKGIPVQMKLTPDFRASDETFANIAPATMTLGATRWQASSTTVEIEFVALVDMDLYTESMQTIEGQDVPSAGWPKSFTLAFTLIHEVSWHIRTRHGGEQQWVPAPRDLAEIETSFFTAAQGKFENKLKGSPANILEVFTPPDETLEIGLGELTASDWSFRCRSLASMYVELGETNEALFWLNVATEALFKERFGEIAIQSGRPNLGTNSIARRRFGHLQKRS